MNYLPYFVARSSASSLDRQGPPSRAFTIIVMLPIAIAVIGLAAVALVAFWAVVATVI